MPYTYYLAGSLIFRIDENERVEALHRTKGWRATEETPLEVEVGGRQIDAKEVERLARLRMKVG